MAETSIEWTEFSWNPLRGCAEISPGCRNCYAAAMAYRFSGPGQPYEGLVEKRPNGKIVWTGRIRLAPEKLDEPLRRRRPTTYFVNSMSDLLHEDVPDEFIATVFGVMALAKHHTFQVLTKRARRMADVVWGLDLGECLAAVRDNPAFVRMGHESLPDRAAALDALRARHGLSTLTWPLPNVWLGTSLEDQARKVRIDQLRTVPAAVRFLSIEPLLEDLGPLDLSGIGWVICGGESGPGARPMHPDWARSLRDQCQAAGVPFFFKQHGEWVPDGQSLPFLKDVIGACDAHPSRALFPDGSHLPDLTGRGDNGDGAVVIRKVGKKAAGRMLDGRTWDELPAALVREGS